MISFGVGKFLIAERRLFDGVIPVDVIVDPANVTVSLQNWNLSAFIIIIPFSVQSVRKSQV